MEAAVAAVAVLACAGVALRARHGDEWRVTIGALAALGALGALRVERVASVLAETAPIVVFLVAITVLARAAQRAGVFEAAALAAARLVGGTGTRLLLAVLALGTATTTVLSLDATVVLLTPVVLALARRTGAPVTPLALAVVLVANAGSLLLPVANLTNLLVAPRLGSPLEFLAAMLPAQVVALGALTAVLWLRYRGSLARPLTASVPPPWSAVTDRTAFAGGLLAVAGVLPAVLTATGWTLAVATLAAAGVAVATGGGESIDPGSPTRRGRGWARVPQIPWRLAVFVLALFVTIDAASQGLLGRVADAAVSGAGPVRAGLVGAAAANLLNNLPALLVLAPEVADGPPLEGLLVGLNLGSNLLPTASLATILWLEQIRGAGVPDAAASFVTTGAAVTAVALPLALLVVALA